MILMRIPVLALSLTAFLVSAAKADDASDCRDGRRVDFIAACSRLIGSGKFQGHKLAKLYHRRAVIWRTVGSDLDKAIADDGEAIRIDPKFAAAISSRGLSLWQKGDFDRALAQADEAILLDPKDGKFYNRRGLVLRSKGKANLAVKDFDEAIRLDPPNARFYNNRGNALRDAGFIIKAQADFTKAIAFDPKYPFAYVNRAGILRYSGNFNGALADSNKALALDPKNGPALVSRGLTFLIIGQAEKAQADFKAALNTQSPNFSDAKWVRETATQKLAALEKMQVSPSVATPEASQTVGATPVNVSRRIALVIGNSAYKNAPTLSNPQRDATLVADTLKRTGFDAVALQNDLGREALIKALRDFAQAAEAADWAVVYYAGHGMEVSGINYLVPVDARMASDRDIGFEAVPLDQVLNAAERARRLRLVILDACRDNPFASQMKRTLTVASRSILRGLASVEPEPGTLVVYAAKDGETALDGDGQNSPFTAAFVKNLQTPGLEVRRLFDVVRDDVMESTRRKQKPFIYGSISGRQDFYFVAAK